jgi:signal transduction histidine kinase/ligand-binding sensor domain-containing protein/CheY-like chemotaxis protein
VYNTTRYIKLTIFFISACLFHGHAYAYLQNNTYSFKQISYENGLPGLNIRDLHQDKDGFLWIGLESVGLCKYDGHSFMLYQQNDEDKKSLSSNYVNKIEEDSSGNLWIATDYGLNQFNKHQNKFIHYFLNTEQNNSLTNNICLTVFIDSKNNILVGTENGLSVKKNHHNAFEQHLNRKDDISLNRISVHAIYENHNQHYWLGTSAGLIKFNLETGHYRVYTEESLKNNSKEHSSNNTILDIIADKYGYLWIATQKGIKLFDLNNEKFTKLNLIDKKNGADIINESVNELMVDDKGKLWAGTSSDGIIVIDPKTRKFFSINKETKSSTPIKSNHIRSIFQDKTGLIWIGTKFEGLFMLNTPHNLFEWPPRFNCMLPLKNKYILSVSSLNDQIIWVGTKEEGLFKVNCKTKSITNYNPDTKIKINSNRIQYIYQDNSNNLWVGTDNGLNYYDKQTSQFIKYGNQSINRISEDRSKRIWVGTSTGMFIYDNKSDNLKRFYSNSNPDFFSSPNIDIMNIYHDRNNSMWIATRYGPLYKYSFQTDKLETYPLSKTDQQVPSKIMARAFHEDMYGNFWIGTKSNGLLLMNKQTGKYSKLNIKNGLPGSMVLCIEEDNNSQLWLGTNNGISSINIKDTSVSNYNSYNGVTSNISETAASYFFNSGDLFFGGYNGFNIFTPSKFVINKYDLSPVINSVQLDDTILYINNQSIKPVIIKHKNSSIRFSFTLPDYKKQFRHNFYVMLEGSENRWRDIGSQNMISYTNLKPGDYVFKIKASNEANITSNIAAIKVKIESAFYQTTAFKALVVALILLVLTVIIYAIKTRQEKLKKVISERTQKLETAYKELLNKNTYIREQNRQIERHHNELEQKVAERTHDLEIAKRKAEESDRLKSAFLANMSHEVRTPLNAITGFSTLVCNESANNERKQKYVDIIKSNTTSLLKLVEDILDISKIEAKQLKIEKVRFDINSMIININTIFQQEIASKKGNKIKLLLKRNSAPNTNLLFYSDPVRIKQIFENLLSNAIKFTSSGEIELGYKIKNQRILFWVSDTGIGIKPEDLKYIFNRFTKVESDNAIYRGTGLGLSISRSLVDMLNGNIWVESEINKGSTFFFEIPGDIEIKTNQYQSKISNASYNFYFSDKKILIVEDERSNYILVQSFLMKTNASTTWAHNGSMAIEHCQSTKYDIILMDIRMPIIDGYETFRQIRKLDPHVPVIAQTAYASPDEKQIIRKAGFNDYIVKPYSKDDILKKIAQLLKTTDKKLT